VFAAAFVLLYAAHLIADYVLQTDHQAARKADRSAAGRRANLAHAGTHVIVCAAALAAGTALLNELHPALWRAAVAVAWIGASHAAIDRRRGITWWMDHTGQTAFRAHGGAAHVDQTAHIVALLIGALIIAAT
jgi:hypothetical protein